MELLSEWCSLELSSIDYDMHTGLIKYQLSGDGVNGLFRAKAFCGNEIKHIAFEIDFDEFLMSLMRLQPKNIFNFRWFNIELYQLGKYIFSSKVNRLTSVETYFNIK
ncbi:hypothetical protein HV213_18045 [Klebsiella sp. RHBSTW-00484]|uniref:hypothetical protein n=1 Tax=unclassified Klebsiella TaxID=2608929 RepID=UPI0015E566DD|nr:MULTISPECIES: hypothetical protein [unclassified Klebsiella]MBA7846523.1 hypothetical protein [Klebsiella sp. RHBSTW-00465]QLO37591.1 hypothetical protein HV213_18045 [Klebsiella sp. RHBSTW-00484]QLT77109.1 hypothetical protein HV204_18045 [Klebsiella sp. RHBSTW-00464]